MPTINFAAAKAFSVHQGDLETIVSKGGEDAEWFKETYGQIALALRLIVSDTSSNRQTSVRDMQPVEYNNVVAISGDRGTGKSSVMYTMLNHLGSDRLHDREILDNLSNEVLQKNKLVSGQSHPDNRFDRLVSFSKCGFLALPPIDPSKFPKKETLLGHVVANIYKQIIDTIETKPDIEINRFDSILERCDKVLEALRIRTLGVEKSMGDNPDDLDMLGKLANTSDLRSCLIKLISEFLDLKCHKPLLHHDRDEDTPFRYLVIAIDDLDTNIDTGYSLAEEIRNFLFIPQVIVLMAIKIEQLSDVVQQHYLSAFSKMLPPNGVLDAQPDEMATKYIQKIIPDLRRVHLPSVVSQSLGSVNVISATNPDSSLKLVEYFLSLVWRKSGILLVKNNQGSHGLLPMNLRGLHQIISLLEGMPDIDLYSRDKGRSLRKNLHNNLQRLEAWLIDSVSSNAIPRDLAVTFRKMAGHPDTGLNGFVVRQLREYISLSENSYLFGQDDTATELVDVRTQPHNISMGDVLYLLDKIEQYNSSAGYMHYTAAIRMLYSLRLTALFYPLSSDETKPCNPDYNAVLEMLGGLIYNPQVKLTLTGREWMYNRNSTLAILIGIEGSCDLKGNQAYDKDGEHDDITSTMSLKDAIWLSFFVVQYGPRLRRGRPSSHGEGAYVRSRFAPETDAFSGFVSINWLAFVHNTLHPQATVERLLGYSYPVEELQMSSEINKLKEFFCPSDIANAKAFLKEVLDWQKDNLSALPLHSIDVVSRLLQSLERNRWRPRERTDKIGKLNEFFHLRQCVESDFCALLEETAVGANSEGESSKSKLIKALLTCPLLNENDVFDVYDVGRESQRKFDWLLTM